MTTEPTIRAAIIEKAARAKFYRAHPEYPAGENHWGNVAESYRQVFRDSVTRTLAPVYADIQAETLREAARVIDCRYVALTPGCDVDALDYDTPTDYGTDLAAWWLTDRADKLCEGQP